MCGINGANFWDETVLHSMNDAIAHRGPDASGVYTDGQCMLGHRRLSVIDLRDVGKQPMSSRDGRYHIVYNGEIYNFQALRAELKALGYSFVSRTDTEVLLYLYAHYGEQALQKVNGMFAFVVYDSQEKVFFGARDQVGIKPLYYFWDGQKLLFSSELKAIRKQVPDLRVRSESVAAFFRFGYIPAPYTIWQHVYKLPPGHSIVYRHKHTQLSTSRYWRAWDGSTQTLCGTEAQEKIRETTIRAIESQLVSDRPVGVFLSGGVDSTIVTTVAARKLPGIHTFSVGYDVHQQSEKYNTDRRLAKRVAKDLGTNHHEFVISGAMVRDAIERISYHMDEPIANHTQPLTYLLAQYASSIVTVVLGGDGGDELFGGYHRYRFNYMLDVYQRIPRYARRVLCDNALATIRKDRSLIEKLRTPGTMERYWLFMVQKDSVLQQVLRPHVLDQSYTSFITDVYTGFSSQEKGFASMFMLLDLEQWLAEESLMRSDKMTMAFGLEQRVSLLDKDLVSLAYRIPPREKIGFRGGKKIFIQAMQEYVPEYVSAAKKRGWISPMAKWLRTDMKDIAYTVLDPSYVDASREYIDFTHVRRLLDNHISQKKYNLDLLWSLITWQLWAKQYL